MARPFVLKVRVYWEDTDGGGVVYYANYLRFLERARTEMLRSLGFDQSVLQDESNIVFVVVSASLEFKKPARLDDLLAVGVEVLECTRASARFRQTIHRDAGQGELLLQAELRAACLNGKSFRPTRMPPAILQALSGEKN